MRFVRTNPVLWPLALGAAAYAVCDTAMWLLLPLVAVRQLGMDPAAIGWTIGAAGAGLVLGNTLSSKVAQRRGVRATLIAGAAVAVGGHIGIAAAIWLAQPVMLIPWVVADWIRRGDLRCVVRHPPAVGTAGRAPDSGHVRLSNHRLGSHAARRPLRCNDRFSDRPEHGPHHRRHLDDGLPRPVERQRTQASRHQPASYGLKGPSRLDAVSNIASHRRMTASGRLAARQRDRQVRSKE